MVAVRNIASKPLMQLRDLPPAVRDAVFESTRTFWSMQGKEVSEEEPSPEDRRRGVVSVDEVRLKSPFHCSRLMRVLIENYVELGLTAEELAATLQHLMLWSYMDTPPFSSEATLSRHTGKSRRTIRRYQKNMEDKGYLVKKARYDKSRYGRRQTSNSHDYNGLIAQLVAIEEAESNKRGKGKLEVREQLRVVTEDMGDQGGRSSVSGGETPKWSPVSTRKKIQKKNEVEDKRILSVSEPSADGSALRPSGSAQEVSDSGSLGTERNTEHTKILEAQGDPRSLDNPDPAPGLPRGTDVQSVDPLITDRVAAIVATIEQAKVKTALAKDIKDAKAVAKAQVDSPKDQPQTWDEKEALLLKKLEWIRSEKKGDRAKRAVMLAFFKPFLAELMQTKFPNSPFPRDWSGPMVGQLTKLVDMWGISNSRALIAYVFTHWGKLSHVVKHSSRTPTLGVILGFSQTFMDEMVHDEEKAKRRQVGPEDGPPLRLADILRNPAL